MFLDHLDAHSYIDQGMDNFCKSLIESFGSRGLECLLLVSVTGTSGIWSIHRHSPTFTDNWPSDFEVWKFDAKLIHWIGFGDHFI